RSGERARRTLRAGRAPGNGARVARLEYAGDGRIRVSDPRSIQSRTQVDSDSDGDDGNGDGSGDESARRRGGRIPDEAVRQRGALRQAEYDRRLAGRRLTVASSRVLVVDDAVVFRRVLTEAISADPDLEVVGAAVDGRAALQKLATTAVDAVILDVEMPNL